MMRLQSRKPNKTLLDNRWGGIVFGASRSLGVFPACDAPNRPICARARRSARNYPTRMTSSRPLLHLVVHHRRDSHQPWANSWLDDQRLEAITTTSEIGSRCADAMARGEFVRVHRCGWSDLGPEVSCEVIVTASQPIDRRTYLVSFDHHRILGSSPSVTPHPGQNTYEA